MIGTNSTGQVQWSKTKSPVFDETVYLEDIVSTSYGYIVAGFYHGSSVAVTKMLLFGLDTVGNLLWCNSYCYDTSCHTSLSTYTFQVIKLSDTLFCVAGETEACPYFYQVNFAFNVDPNGNLKWSKIYDSNTTSTRSVTRAGYRQIVLSGEIDNMIMNTKSVLDSVEACDETNVQLVVEPYFPTVLNGGVTDSLSELNISQDPVTTDTLNAQRILGCFVAGVVDSTGSGIISSVVAAVNSEENGINIEEGHARDFHKATLGCSWQS